MSEIQENELKHSIANKLSPERFAQVSGRQFACLGALLNTKYTDPRLASIVATSDGMLLGRNAGDVGFNDMIGSFEDFERNTLGMADAAGDLTEREIEFLKQLLDRVKNGIETSAGDTTMDLSIEGLESSPN
jgi:hypothetical protein